MEIILLNIQLQYHLTNIYSTYTAIAADGC